MKKILNDSISEIQHARQDALKAWDSVRTVASIWGIQKERFVDDWLSHVYGEKTGLEHERAFSD